MLDRKLRCRSGTAQTPPRQFPVTHLLVVVGRGCELALVAGERFRVDPPALDLADDVAVVVDLDDCAADGGRLVRRLVAVGVVEERLDRHARILRACPIPTSQPNRPMSIAPTRSS